MPLTASRAPLPKDHALAALAPTLRTGCPTPGYHSRSGFGRPPAPGEAFLPLSRSSAGLAGSRDPRTGCVRERGSLDGPWPVLYSRVRRARSSGRVGEWESGSVCAPHALLPPRPLLGCPSAWRLAGVVAGDRGLLVLPPLPSSCKARDCRSWERVVTLSLPALVRRSARAAAGHPCRGVLPSRDCCQPAAVASLLFPVRAPGPSVGLRARVGRGRGDVMRIA
jgi:hypothetical protein